MLLWCFVFVFILIFLYLIKPKTYETIKSKTFKTIRKCGSKEEFNINFQILGENKIYNQTQTMLIEGNINPNILIKALELLQESQQVLQSGIHKNNGSYFFHLY